MKGRDLREWYKACCRAAVADAIVVVTILLFVIFIIVLF